MLNTPPPRRFVVLWVCVLASAVVLGCSTRQRGGGNVSGDSFYRRVRPGGPGWRNIARGLGMPDEPIANGALSWVNWIAAIVAVYATLFGVGKLIFGPRMLAAIYLAVAALAFTVIAINLKSEHQIEHGTAD
jgi:hypothetical protein